MDHPPEDDFRTDYAALSTDHPTPDSATNPIRLQAPPTGGRAAGGRPDYPFLLPATTPGEIGRLGNYRVLRLLGQGGMAYVFLAEDLTLHRKVALKIVKPQLASDMDAWQRFLREARIMASIKHDHLVPVFQVGREGSAHYLAMELLEGETLESWCTRVGQAKPRDIVRVAREIATGLDMIHRQGLVHRDIKPGNLWLESSGQRVKILDLGLARSFGNDTCFTQPGTIVGTPAFMSPEQARGEALDARSDLFSLGAVMYRMATGRLPFPAPTTMGILSALAVCTPRPVSEHNPALPRPLAKLIMQLLAKDPEERPATAQAVIEQLRRLEKRPAETGVRAEPFAKPAPRTRRGIKKSPVPAAAAPHRRWVIVALAIFMALAAVSGSAVVLGVGIASLAIVPAADAKVYLSDLKPSEIKNWEPGLQPKGPLMQKKGPPGPPKDFADVRIAGQRFPHGILMHAPPEWLGGPARLGYRLDGQYATFHAEVSLNDGPFRSESPLTFSVLGDGKLLWQSQGISKQDDNQQCSIAVKGVNDLTIQVQCAGDPRGGHAVWIEPHVVK